MLLFLSILAALIGTVAGGPVCNVQITLRGKKYDLPSPVSNVRELQKSVEDLTGLSPAKQSVLFDGKKLHVDDVLEDAGVVDGAVINIVPSKKKGGGSSSSRGGGASSAAAVASVETTAQGNLVDGDGDSGDNSMESLLKQAGIDQDKLKGLMDSMDGGGAGDPGKMPDMAESMKMMQEMANSPMFQEYMTDPERLEQSRQMILNNPMMKGMMGGVPGFEEILNDKEKWRESMISAANMYKDMSSNPGMMEAMMGGMMGGLGDGLNGAMDGSGASEKANAALDELSEGDD